MANHRQGTVIFVDTSAGFKEARRIKAIKYIGSSNGTATVTNGTGGSGNALWEESGTSNIFNQVCFNSKEGVHVAVTNGATVYLYLE